MQSVHDFFDRAIKVPPVDVEQIDVGRAEFLQARFDGNMKRFGVVSDELNLLLDRGVTFLVSRSILESRRMIQIKSGVLEVTHLCSDEELITDSTFFCPFTDDLFGAFFLAKGQVSGIDYVEGDEEKLANCLQCR